MFNNFINIHDIFALVKKIIKLDFKVIFSKLFSSRHEKTKKIWDVQENSAATWLDIPKIKDHCNFLISGNPNIDSYSYLATKYLSNKKSLAALSLGSGNGKSEENWVKYNKFKRIDCYDLSESIIDFAKERAIKNNYNSIVNYQAIDVNKLEKSPDSYDIIYAEHSLHHFTPLENILVKISKFLKKDGLLFINEYVGPSRFQWDDNQLKIINNILQLLPEKYKLKEDKKSLRLKAYKYSKLRMILHEPSEAVESANILPLLKKIFKILEIKEYGGTILQYLLFEIGHNFLLEDSLTNEIIDILIKIEDMFIKNKILKSDFIVAICNKK